MESLRQLPHLLSLASLPILAWFILLRPLFTSMTAVWGCQPGLFGRGAWVHTWFVDLAAIWFPLARQVPASAASMTGYKGEI
jgi:hypothetical protein